MNDFRFKGDIDVWMHNPPKHEESDGIGSLLGAALGIGALVSLFADKKPEQITHVHQYPPQPVPAVSQGQKSHTFELAFTLIDCMKKILRNNESNEILETIVEILRSLSTFIFDKESLFSDIEFKVLSASLNDVLAMMSERVDLFRKNKD
jgi:hypothetical protein